MTPDAVSLKALQLQLQLHRCFWITRLLWYFFFHACGVFMALQICLICGVPGPNCIVAIPLLDGLSSTVSREIGFAVTARMLEKAVAVESPAERHAAQAA